MIGSNRLQLNEGTMRQILTDWLNKQALGVGMPRVQVTSITKSPSGYDVGFAAEEESAETEGESGA